MRATGGHETIWLDVGGLRVKCLVAGAQGPPVLLLHGGGTSSAGFAWRHTIEALAGSYRVFAPDLPGYGASDKPEITYTIDFYADVIGMVMDALELDTAALVGLSLGAWAALGFALDHPRRATGLALVSSGGVVHKLRRHWLVYLYVHAPRLNESTFSLMGRGPRRARWLLSSYVGDTRVITPEMVTDALEGMRVRGAGHAFVSTNRHEVTWRGMRTDYSARLHQLHTPTLIVHGERDRLIPLAAARRAARLIPDAELAVLARCGHIPQREEPEQFNRLLLRFLDRLALPIAPYHEDQYREGSAPHAPAPQALYQGGEDEDSLVTHDTPR